MNKPILYDKFERDFSHLGLGVLQETVSCIVTEEINGVFELEMTYPMSGTLFPQLEVDQLVKVDAGHNLVAQRFRIKRLDKGTDGLIHVFAEHVSYETKGLAMRPEIHIVNQTGTEALAAWSGEIVTSHPFVVSSNITRRESLSLSIQNVRNPREALGKIASTWGGEYLFDNYQIILRNNRGGRANTLIAYGRNLIDLEQEENITNTYTSIYPFAIYRNAHGGEEIVTVPGFIVDSAFVGAFPSRRVLPVDFSSEFENRPTGEQLRALALKYMETRKIGIPKVSLSVSFVDLTKTLSHSSSNYEQVQLGDVVPVYFEALNIRAEAKIVRVRWDVLLGQYERLEIGEVRQSFGDNMRQVTNVVEDVRRDSSAALLAANGRNTVFFSETEPVANRVGDLWYRQNGDDVELFMWRGNVWQFISTTAPDERILKRIREGEAATKEALENAEAALTLAKEARKDVGKVVILSDGLQMRMTELGEDVAGVEVAVTLLSDQFHVAVGDLVTSSGLTMLKDQINLRVVKGDVINQINLSPEAILIAGNRVHITGQTTIDEAVIRDAHIGNISADKITSGTLNASHVNIINMNANHITTGRLTGVTVESRQGNNVVTLNDGIVSMSWNNGANNLGASTLTPNFLQFRPTQSNLLQQGEQMPANLQVEYRPEGIYRRIGNNNHSHFINFVAGSGGVGAGTIRIFGQTTFLHHVGFNGQDIHSVRQLRLGNTGAGTGGGIRFPGTTGDSNWQLTEANNNLVAQAGNLHVLQNGRKLVSFISANGVGSFGTAPEFRFWSNRADQGNWANHPFVSIYTGGIGLGPRTANGWTHFYLGCTRGGENRSIEVGTNLGSVHPSIVYRPMRASAFPVQSTARSKTNLRRLEEEGINALGIINHTQIWKYHIKSDVEARIYDKAKIGVISEMAHPLIRDEDGIDPYSMVSLSWKAIQQLYTRILYLEKGANNHEITH